MLYDSSYKRQVPKLHVTYRLAGFISLSVYLQISIPEALPKQSLIKRSSQVLGKSYSLLSKKSLNSDQIQT